MKRLTILLAIAILWTGSAIADPMAPRVCVDPSRPYRATWISGRDILVTSIIGKHRGQVRLETTCIGLDRTAHISVSAATNCIALGDDVSIKRLGEPGQTCKVSKVDPAPLE
ncbi:MAG: hypothetical protein ACRECA_13200 [Pseudolabrys sp.]